MYRPHRKYSLISTTSQAAWKVFKLEGSSDFYLFVKPRFTTLSICSNLKADKSYIISGSAGQACPAHPRNKFNNMYLRNDWMFMEEEEESWKEGGVIVWCNVHEHCSTD